MNTPNCLKAVPALLRGVAVAAMIGSLTTPALASSDGKVVFGEIFTPASGWALESADSYMLARAGCLEGLTRMDYDASIQPALAVSWERVSPTVWELRLRDGVRFHDGTLLTAEVVSSVLNRLLGVTTPPRMFSPKQIAAVEAVGADVVRITTHEPDVFVPNRLASPETGILSPGAFQNGAVNPAGRCTGPFEIVREVRRQGLELKRNDNYWGGEVKLAAGEVRFIPDPMVRTTMVETGEAQIARAVPVSALAGLERARGVEVKTIGAPRTTSLYMNHQRPPLNNVKVRQAIQQAIDVAMIAESVYEGAAHPAVGLFSPDSPWAPASAAVVEPNLERAKALLAESGVPASELQLELIAYVERTELPDVAAVIQYQLQQLGIQVSIRVGESTALEPRWLAGDFDMTLMSRGYLTDVGDPVGALVADYSCGGSWNLSNFCDPAVDARLTEATGLEDAAARAAIYQEVAAKLQAEAVTVFLVHETISEAVSERVEGYAVHPFERIAFHKDLDIKP